MIFRGEGGEIRTDFGEDDLGGARTDPVRARQVDAGKAPEDGAGLLFAARLDGFLFGRIRVGWNRFCPSIWGLQGLDFLEQLGVIGGDLGFQRVEQMERGSEVEEMLVAPSAGEIPGDLLGRLLTAAVTVRGETGRIA